MKVGVRIIIPTVLLVYRFFFIRPFCIQGEIIVELWIQLKLYMGYFLKTMKSNFCRLCIIPTEVQVTFSDLNLHFSSQGQCKAQYAVSMSQELLNRTDWDESWYMHITYSKFSMKHISCTCQFLVQGKIIAAFWNLFRTLTPGQKCKVEYESF